LQIFYSLQEKITAEIMEKQGVVTSVLHVETLMTGIKIYSSDQEVVIKHHENLLGFYGLQ